MPVRLHAAQKTHATVQRGLENAEGRQHPLYKEHGFPFRGLRNDVPLRFSDLCTYRCSKVALQGVEPPRLQIWPVVGKLLTQPFPGVSVVHEGRGK